jgi:hypothetical protein
VDNWIRKEKARLHIVQLIDGVPQAGDVEDDEVDENDGGQHLERAHDGPTAEDRALVSPGGSGLAQRLACGPGHSYFLAVPPDSHR